MLRPLFIIICFLSSKLFHAQQLTGRVTDAITGQAVSYASIGLTKANQGTTATEDGQFTLGYLSQPAGDSLVVSCVGYQTVKLPVEKNKISYEVLLERKNSQLKDVVIRHYSRKITLPRNKVKPSTILFTKKIISHIQAAQLLEAPAAFTRLESVTIDTKRSMFIPKKKARFRVRIYDYDSIAHKPGPEICDSLIEVYGSGIITVKLDKFKIIIPQKRFFVAVQWLFIEENLETEKSDGPGYDFYYRPGIRMNKVTEGEGNTWMQYHDQRWIRWKFDLAVTATVLY